MYAVPCALEYGKSAESPLQSPVNAFDVVAVNCIDSKKAAVNGLYAACALLGKKKSPAPYRCKAKENPAL